MDRNDDDLLDVSQLAHHLRVDRRTVRRMVEGGRLPAPVRYGGLARWRWGVIRDWQRAWEIMERLNRGGQSGTPAGHSGTNGPDNDLAPSKAKKER